MYVRYLLKKLRTYYLYKYKHKLKICGLGTYFGRNVYIRDGSTSLGKNVYIGSNCRISSDNVTISDFTMLANNVSIIGGDYDFTQIGRPMCVLGKEFGIKKQQPVIIGADVWIGHGAVIMSGVRIGDCAIVGANAVVTKDIPKGEIWGGVPAKKIRNRFNEENHLKEHLKALESFEINLWNY